MSSTRKTLESHCNKCGGDRVHRVLHHHTERGSEYLENLQTEVCWRSEHYMLQCAGCRSVSLRTDSSNDLTDEWSTSYLPPAAFRSKPEWMLREEFTKSCPKSVQNLVEEIYVCLQSECNRSVAMAVRAILEAVMIHRVGDHRSFPANLGAFVTAGFLSANQRKIIEPVLEAGHAAIHRNFEPTREQLVVLIDVTEAVLATTYLHPRAAAALASRVPRRKKKAPKTGVAPPAP